MVQFETIFILTQDDDMYLTPTNNLKASGTYPKSRTWCWERSRTSGCWSGRRLKKRNFVVRKLYNGDDTQHKDLNTSCRTFEVG